MKNKYSKIIAILAVVFFPITILILLCWLICYFLGLVLLVCSLIVLDLLIYIFFLFCGIYRSTYEYLSKEKD